MLMTLVGATVGGMLIGGRFRAFSLVPAIGVAVMVLCGLVVAGQLHWTDALLRSVLLTLGMQAGYVCGILTAGKKRSMRTGLRLSGRV